MEETERMSKQDSVGTAEYRTSHEIMSAYVDNIVSEYKLKQENEVLLEGFTKVIAGLCVLKDELAEVRLQNRTLKSELAKLKQQNTALAERMDYLEDVCLTDISDELMKKHQMELPEAEPPGHDPPPVAREIKPKRIATQIISSVLPFLCTALLLIGIAAVTPVGMEGDLFGFRHYYINTPSMLPEMPVGSVVLTKITSPESIKVGDDISVRMGDAAYLTHRVVDITYDTNGEPRFYTKGINNKAADPEPYSAELVAGKVVLCIPLLGRLLTFVQTHFSLMVVLFVMMLLTTVILRPPRMKKKPCKTAAIAANAAPI